MTAINRASFRLVHDQARQLATEAIRRAPDGWTVAIKPPGRSLDQNARLHAMLSDIAASGFEWGGCQRTIDELKTLFVSAWMVETGRTSEVVRGFNDEPVQMRRSTAVMSREELGELMDMIEAFCAQRGIRLSAPARDR